MVSIRKPKNALVFTQPASWWGSTWREALPSGNGVIGAAVYGGAADDTIMINHGDLWWQGHVGVLQDVSDKLKDVRKKAEEGNPGASDVLSDALIAKGYRPQPAYPLPLCNLNVKMRLTKPAREYSRVLNMENGEVSVVFKDGPSRVERSMFVSRAHDLVAYEITKTGAKSIDVRFSFGCADKFNARTASAISKTPESVNVKYENYFMYFSARSDNGTEFGAVAFVNYYGGSMKADENGLAVTGADKVLVLVKPFIESQREKEWKALKTKLSSIKLTYDKLLKEHTPLHNKLFNSAELDLTADDRDACADALKNDTFESGILSPALAEKLWAYGRYLTVCGSSPVSAPLAPYGLWCGDYKAENAQITAAGSLQTMYAHTLAGNLPEYIKSVFTYYESVLDDLRKNSSRLYGCRGILVPAVMARGTGVFGSVDSRVLHFTAAGGWLCRLFYDYCLVTEDTKFLKEHVLPFMREVVMFYEEFFKVTSETYESCPSYSFGAEGPTAARNALVDFAVARDVIANLVEGSEAVGAYKTEVAKWKDMLTRIPRYRYTEEGTVREYLDSRCADSFASAAPTMFYPVYPATEIDRFDPEPFKAFAATARKKYAAAQDDQSALTLGQYAALFARLNDGEAALDVITEMVRAMMMNNLVTAASDWRGMGIGAHTLWANYTIEGNLAITNAMQEMLLHSSRDSISLLPALPAAFEKGAVSGLLTRVGAEVDMTWDMRKGVVIAKIKAKKSKKIRLVMPAGAKKFKPIGSETVDYLNGIVKELSLPGGKTVTVDIRL